ncbi:MAG: DUF2164 family protein [Candidatus Shapirobacteria bacterium]
MDKQIPIVISPENKELLKKELVDYFATEKDIDIGLIAAEEILDTVLQKVDRAIYNQAIEDAQKVIRQGNENIVVNVGSLTKS